ncbi:MAG: Rieske 2Fe-2S domain-containing protein [Actinobacteria bacterium]|nr:Rieske 2Fe-2S domain-containing protein [Actinomycetota bacterium]
MDREWVEVADLKDLERRRKLLVEIDDTPIALFLVDGDVRAFHNVCIHKQRQLIKGTILKGRVICPGHQWAFDLNTGWEEGQGQCQPVFAAKVEGDKVLVDPSPRVLDTAPGDAERWSGA